MKIQLDRLYKKHQPLFKYLLLAEWLFLGIALSVDALALGALGGLRSIIALLALAILSGLSLQFPDGPHESHRRKVVFLTGEALLVTIAVVAGSTACTMPLYCVLVAKACMLFDGRERWLIAGAALAAEVLIYSVKSRIAEVVYQQGDPLGTAVGFVIILMVKHAHEFAFLLIATFVMVALISEQRLRWKTQQLSKELETMAAELERTRIAREIHDTLGHTLTTLKLQLEVARKFGDVDRMRATRALRMAEQLSSRALTDVRVTLQQIRESDFDFEKSVGELIKNVEASSSLRVRTEFPEQDLPISVSYQLFRVIQECMTNTLRHADAKRISISAGVQNGKVSMVFWDDGNGFSYTAGTEGFGIRGMRERIEGLKGSINVASRAEGGTEVLVEVPMPKPVISADEADPEHAGKVSKTKLVSAATARSAQQKLSRKPK